MTFCTCCQSSSVELRLLSYPLPQGLHHSNAKAVCFNCYSAEVTSRLHRNLSLNIHYKLPIPSWQSLSVVSEANL